MGYSSSAWMVGVALFVTACGGGNSSGSSEPSGSSISSEPSEPSGSLPFDDTGVSPEQSAVAEDLAPSQIAAPTVAPPATPPPCALADLQFWTSQVYLGDQSADAIVRVRNLGDAWCEFDISNSPQIDPEIEPAVWLDPGGWADLVVGQSGDDCFEPTLVSSAQIDVHGDAAVVPTTAIATCGWRLTSFYPVDVAADPCAELGVAHVEGFVLVRNGSLSACVLGELVQVAGPNASTQPRTDFDVPAVIDLAPGDVVAFAHRFDPTEDCDDAAGAGTLVFDVAGGVVADQVVCGAVYELGFGRPWFGDVNGPLASATPETFDLEDALAALNPFE